MKAFEVLSKGSKTTTDKKKEGKKRRRKKEGEGNKRRTKANWSGVRQDWEEVPVGEGGQISCLFPQLCPLPQPVPFGHNIHINNRRLQSDVCLFSMNEEVPLSDECSVL